MARRRFRLSIGVVFVGFFLLAAFFLVVPTRYTSGINYYFVKITSPLLSLFPKSTPRDNDMISRQEYDKLQQDYANIYAKYLKLHGDYEKLSGIRQKMPETEGKIVMAKIVRSSLSGARSELVIDKGTEDHLRLGQYVLSPEQTTVIGTIIEVVEQMARVRLVTDPRHHLIVSILREGSSDFLPGQLKGKDAETARIPFISKQKYDIRAGDVVYASPQPGFLGLELIIGNISEVNIDDGEPLLWDITVKPIQNFSYLTDVAIVIMDPETNGLSE